MSAASTSIPQDTVGADPLRLLSVKDLAVVFGVGEHAIRKRIRLRQLGPVIRRGKGYVMRAEVLKRYFEDAEQEWETEGRVERPLTRRATS